MVSTGTSDNDFKPFTTRKFIKKIQQFLFVIVNTAGFLTDFEWFFFWQLLTKTYD